MRVLHFDSERGFGGGQRQLLFLLRELARESGLVQALAARSGSEIAVRARELGLTFFPIPCANDLDIWSAGVLKRAILAFRPDVVHAHASRALGISALARRLLPWKPPPWVVHTRRVVFPLRGWLSREKYRHGADFHIGVCRAAVGQMKAAGVPAERLALIPSGVEIPETLDRASERASLLERTGFPPSSLLLGSSGGLLAVKRFDWLVQAVAEVRRECRDLRLALWGGGPERFTLEALVREGKLEGAVRLLGHVEKPERWYGGLDLFSLASHTEGIGISLVEATARGVPLLASRTGGLVDVVEEGVNGLFFDPSSREDLAAKLRQLAKDPALRESLSAAGPALARERFDVKVVTRHVLQAYRKVAGGP